MKISTAALLFLILAAHLGPPAQASLKNRSPDRGESLSLHTDGQFGVHRPGDCCLSYTTRNIRCTFMKDYYLTTSGCSQPGVIFKTRRGQKVCFHPSANGVQECLKKLANTRKQLVEENEY
ncbi:C-C motif chemokine 15-like [Phyllostomus hastatus]|uniref:C-C motif chemokine 15-like n=1 Tax=Phyllostomus hastatus TaxID=9423 RepID=UPI001E67F98C|nr:C-C motif chemokine 15-like [Phyllostomus hastatus]